MPAAACWTGLLGTPYDDGAEEVGVEGLRDMSLMEALPCSGF